MSGSLNLYTAARSPSGCHQRRLSAAGFARSAAPASASTAIECAGVQLLGCRFEPTSAARRRATDRSCGGSGRMSTVAPAISALGPSTTVTDTPARPSADRSASQSASQRSPEGLPNPRVDSRVLSKSENVPVNAVSQCRWPHAIRHACIRTSNNNSTPALRRRRSTLQRITASLTQTRAPAMQFPQPGSCTSQLPETGHPGKIPAGRPLPLRTPFERTVRLIQKSHPAILAVTGSDHSPGGTGIRNSSGAGRCLTRLHTY